MLNSIGNIIPQFTPLTLVDTTLPNSSALRVPYDNVAPSVSSAQIDNNASANRDFVAKTNIHQPSPPAGGAGEKFSLNEIRNSASFSVNAQTAFLAQLASGDISSEVHGIFVQYEKLLSYANVKYKPSNAGKPTDNAGLFSTLLQLDKNSTQHIMKTGDPVALPPDVELPIDNEPEVIPVNTENFRFKEARPQREILLSRLNAYIATISRNLNVTPADLESA